MIFRSQLQSMAVAKFISRYLLLLYLCTNIGVHCQPVCLLRPFVSSIMDITYVVNQTNPSELIFNLEFVLNYNQIMKWRGLKLIFNEPKSPERITLLPTGDLTMVARITEILFTQDKIIAGNKTTEFMYSHRLYMKDLRYHIETYKGAPIHVAGECSPIYINDADYYAAVNETHQVHVTYHGTTRCLTYYRYIDGNWIQDNSVNIQPLRRITWPNNIASAFHVAPFVFELTADSKLHLEYFGREDNLTHNPFKGPKIQLDYDLTNFPKNDGGLMGKEFCHNRIREMDLLRDDRLADFYFTGSAPYRTLSRYDDKHFIAVRPDSSNGRSPYEILTDPKAGGNFEVLKSAENPFLLPPNYIVSDKQLQALSIIFDENGIKYTEAIFLQPFTRRVFYHKGPGIPTVTLHSYALPDDITHWKPCRKIVSIYGFAYTLHNYEQNILAEPVVWQIFDKNLFNYPIEAMHAEGDEFWFLTKRSTVRIMSADSTRCSQLSLRFVREIQLNQLFDWNVKQVHVEGRYYDLNTNQWEPPLNYLPQYEPTKPPRPQPQPQPQPPPPSPQKPSILPFIIGGIIVTAGCLILVLIYVLKSSAREHGGIIYSKSHGSLASAGSHGSKLPRSRESPPSPDDRKSPDSPGSSMPLFSELGMAKTLGNEQPKRKSSPNLKKSSPKIMPKSIKLAKSKSLKSPKK